MRKLAIAAAVSLGLSGVSYETIALDLGEIEIFSALNQNLDAEIGLLRVPPAELDGVRARLANADAFTRAGLSMTPVLRGLRFNVEQRPDGAPIIKVYSDLPVVEPFLNFLVQVDSPTASSQVREYTLLLDPPAFASERQPESVNLLTDTEIFDSTSIGSPVSLAEVTEEDTGIELVLGQGNLVTDAPVTSEPSTPERLGPDVNEPDLAVENPLPTVTFTEQRAGSEDRLRAVTPLPGLASQVVSSSNDEGGTSIDLRRELFASAEPVTDEAESSVQVALDGFVRDTAAPIFTAETEEQPENIVNLADLQRENQIRQQGQSVGLESIAPRAERIEPEVYLDAETTVLVADPADTNANTMQPSQSELSGSTLDLSTIEDTDASLPMESAEVPSLAGDAATSVDPVGEALDISGVVIDIANSLGTSEQTVERVSVPVPADNDNEPLPAASGSPNYTVQRGDTLWSIARTQRPSGVSIQQMLRTIVNANPQTFANGDANSIREGARLTIPGGSVTAPAQTSASGVNSVVRANADNRLPSQSTPAKELPDSATVLPQTETPAVVTESVPAGAAPSTNNQTPETELSTDLDDVNKRMMAAQEELTAEALQRDELSNRVDELEDSLSKMKALITLRESELSNLQSEKSVDDGARVDTPTDTPNTDSQTTVIERDQADGELDDQVRRLSDQINENVAQAQERVDAQADADKNLASAQAQVQSLRLANEEDALRQQLAQLRLEKEQLVQTAQADKLELVRQAEAEKAQLLENASLERERILAGLEEEKQRITDEAAVQRARIAAEAETEKQRLIKESAEMRGRLEALEAQNNQLVAQAELDKEQLAEATRRAEEEQARLLAEAEAEKKKFEEEALRVQDKLAELQKEANANLAGSAANQPLDLSEPADADTDASGSPVDNLAAPALIGGGLAATPLEREIGDRTKVLAAGGGIALLGLVGAWATRRRKPSAGRGAGSGASAEREDVRAEDRLARDPAGTNRVDVRGHQYDAPDTERPTMGQAAVAAGAAAAATGAAIASPQSNDDVADQIDVENQPEPDTAPEQLFEDDSLPPMVDEVPTDDTLTEADVYLRYGLHGQAEDLLKGAIEKSPEIPEYHLKLMESYHDQKNTSEFKAAAQSFKDRFSDAGPHWEKISTMGRNLDSSDGMFSRATTIGAAAAAGVASASNDSDAGDVGALSLETGAGEIEPDISLDNTIDAGSDFNVADLEATGDLSAITDALTDDLDEINLDEVDLAALDDDGTLNLEEFTGDQMSGLDLGTLDLTNPEGDSTLDNLTLDDADLNALGDLRSNTMEGMSPHIELDESAISRVDEMETMLDLAKAYIDMGDSDSATSALKDIVEHGSDTQKMEAQDLLSKLR